MMNDEQRMLHDQLAASIEWALDPEPVEDALAADPFLSPDAAVVVLAQLLDRYEGLSEWADAAKRAAETEAALQTARRAGASKAVLNALNQTASEAKYALGDLKLPSADKPYDVLATYAALQRVAAQRPKGYGNF